MGAGWSTNSLPKDYLNGKRVVITGANSGLGFYTARDLASVGAEEVILACRSKERGEEALKKLREAVPNGNFTLKLLDLSSLKDIERFANEINADGKPLHFLVNNAGVMMCPFSQTADGFELQVGTNHLGHFALTGRLVPSLTKANSPTFKARVVNVSSMMAWPASFKKIDPIDFKKSEKVYNKDWSYCESKFFNLLFTNELARRHPEFIVCGAHPGFSNTNLQQHMGFYLNGIAQHAEVGALPTIRAVCDPEAKTTDYFGPRGAGWVGYPIRVWSPSLAKDVAYGKKLWDASVEATGVQY